MPLVRIDLRKGKDAAYRQQIGRVVYEALIGVGVPKDDRFQVISEYDAESFLFDSDQYAMGVACSSNTKIAQFRRSLSKQKSERKGKLMKNKQSSPSTQRPIIRADKAITTTAWRNMIKEVL